MDLIVPWRLLVPFEAFDAVAGPDGSILAKIASETGVRLDVMKSGALVNVLGGPVVTIHGSMWQKRTAGRRLVDALFELQGCDAKPAIEQAIPIGDPRQRWWQFSGKVSIVLPNSAYSPVISNELRKSVDDIGARMQVDSLPEDSATTLRFLAHLQGNAQQVVSAMSRVGVAVQDLVDHFQLHAADFVDDGGEVAPPPGVAEVVRAARLAPAAGVAVQPPHDHPAMLPLAMQKGVAAKLQLAQTASESPTLQQGRLRSIQPALATSGRDDIGLSRTSNATSTAANSAQPLANGSGTSVNAPEPVASHSGKVWPSSISILANAPQPLVSHAENTLTNGTSTAVNALQPLASHADKAWASAMSIAAAGSGMTQLLLVLPTPTVQHDLISQGHLAEIARLCCVRIDVMPGGTPTNGAGAFSTLTLTGPIVANSLATLQLQLRLAQLI